MAKTPFLIRPARIEDADAIAHVHHQSWEETYPGLMPPELLERVSLDYRLTLWRRIIHERPVGVARFVATMKEATPGKVATGFPSGVATTKEATPGKVATGFPSGDATPEKIVAIASCGPAREKELGTAWEIHMIYVLREAQATGVGTALMRAMFDHLKALDNTGSNADRSIGLWALKGNDRAIRFYEKHGFTRSGTVKRDERHGVVIEDVAMRREGV